MKHGQKRKGYTPAAKRHLGGREFQQFAEGQVNIIYDIIVSPFPFFLIFVVVNIISDITTYPRYLISHMVKMKPEEKIGNVKASKTVSERERHSEDEKRTS